MITTGFRLIESKDGVIAGMLSPWFSRAHTVADNFGLRWSLISPHLGYAARKDRAPQSLDGGQLQATAWPGAVTIDSDGRLISQILMSAEHIRQLREARGLSREAAAMAASHLRPTRSVSHKAIETIELDGHVPEQLQLIARLDTVYDADGRLGIERTHSSQWRPRSQDGHYDIEFPSYWTGPVWLQVLGPAPTEIAVVELRWGPWRRRQQIRSGTVITTRKATITAPPLRALLPN